ncbi:MAG TPA: cytochrome c biogenesis protein CcsA [Phycisphaerales bacterium]|nr:cytochrome c biogenesis protein CcsA [Phycisphaerales bacterium]
MAALIGLAALVGLLAPAASAQQAPAGNAHPEAAPVSDESRDLANPFGDFEPEAGRTVAEKAAFARSVDISPLRGVAVFHAGRVKVLDTLAREMVERVSGKRRLDLIESGEGKGTRVANFDPLFTLLDMTIDPAFYVDKPLIGVNFLPLREAILERTLPDENARDAWLKSGRVTPRMLDAASPELRSMHMHEPAWLEAISRADENLMIFASQGANFELVPPATRDLPWKHVAALPTDHPARRAALELGAAWRALDVAKANDAAEALAAALPTISPDVYPTSRRTLELFYNDLRAFEWGWVLYALSLVTLLIAFATSRRGLAWAGTALLVGGVAMHAGGFVMRCIIAERFAIQNQFESMTGLSLFGVAVALAIMIARRQWLFGAAGAAVGFLVLVTATQAAIPGQAIAREAAILNTSVLLKYHVTTVLVSYALIALGFVLSLFYLGTHYIARAKKTPVLAAAALGESADGTAPPVHKTLADLDAAQMVALQLAFWTLGVGILLGAWWADHSWGRWWAFDPKETWALITWIIYLIVIHVRIGAGQRKGFVTAWLSVVGFVVMLWTYFGVNLLLPGLHAYA